MTLQSAISNDNLIKIRADKYLAGQYVVSVPNVVVVQFAPSVAPSDSVYAQISVGSVGSGSMSDIKSYQTVIYSTTTDYGATETYRTYVRKVSGTSTLYIGRNGQSLTTSHYVTVLNTYDIFEKPGVMRNDTRYSDWDIAYRRLLPVESDLPTAIVLTDGTTAWTPTANPKAIDNDATTSFTHAWESSNSSDTLDSGGTSASPSWTLQAGAHRWIRYTFTDSNGNANLRVISVWTVPKDLSSVALLGFIGQDASVANISYQQGLGWTCNVPAISGITELLKGTFVCVFSLETYNDTRGSIDSNIDFCGYLGTETTVTRGDEKYGRISETRFVVNGFGAKLATLSVPIVNPNNTSSPTMWDDIENVTPLRVVTYLLTEYTTILHLCPMKFPSDHTDYIADEDLLNCEMDTATEAVQYEADAMSSILQSAADGTLDISYNLVEDDDTARDAAPVVAAMQPSDWLDYSVDRDPDPRTRILVVYGGCYNTSSGEYNVYRAVVPPIADIRGYEEAERVNIVLTSNLSDANARAEMAQRAANLYAALNPTDVLKATLKDEWRFLQPDVGAWYTFAIDSADTTRGFAYDSNTRWQLLDISYDSNNQTGRKSVQGTFRRETQNTGANIEVTKVVTDPANNINALPGVIPPFSGGNLGLTDGVWFDSFDTAPPSDDAPPGADCEVLGFRPKYGLGADTNRGALLGETVAYIASGFGKLQSGGTNTFNFAGSSGGWVAQGIGDPYPGIWTITSGTSAAYGGGEWSYGDVTRSDGSDSRVCYIVYDLGSIQRVTNVNMTYSLTKGTYFSPSNPSASINYSLDGTAYTALEEVLNNDDANGTGKTLEYDDDAGVNARYIGLFVRSSQQHQDGDCSIQAAAITTVDRYGDALYEWTDDTEPSAYGSGDGLLFNLVQPASIPSYNDGHSYELTENSVASGPVRFTFDTPYTLSEMDYWSLQFTVCFLGL